MADLTRDDVAHLAGLARIDLSDAELDRMVGELGVILESVAVVQQAPTAGVEPMSHPMPLDQRDPARRGRARALAGGRAGRRAGRASSSGSPCPASSTED